MNKDKTKEVLKEKFYSMVGRGTIDDQDVDKFIDQAITQAKQERTEEIIENLYENRVEAYELFKKMIDEDADRQKARNNFLVSIKKINNVKT